MVLSKEHDFPYWIAWGSVLEGWALAASGELHEGESKMQSGLALYRDTGALLFEPWSLALLADVYLHAGRIEEALESTSRALESSELLHGYFYGAEFHRLKGELMLARHADVPAAENCFLHALKIAQEQGARSLELRCAVSLGELRKLQGQEDECRELVRGVLDQFDQGLDTRPEAGDPAPRRRLSNSAPLASRRIVERSQSCNRYGSAAFMFTS